MKEAAQRLKARHPGLPMALVTHGQEMFALQTGKRAGNESVHQIAHEPQPDDGIPVHVCETHAGWRGLAAEDFPAYVDVAPSGPSQIRNYEALDYVRLVVPRSTVRRRAEARGQNGAADSNASAFPVSGCTKLSEQACNSRRPDRACTSGGAYSASPRIG